MPAEFSERYFISYRHLSISYHLFRSGNLLRRFGAVKHRGKWKK